MAKNPKKKKQLVDKQIELIDKQIKAVPRILTNIQMQNLILEREKLILSKEDTQQYREESSGVTPTMGLKAIGAAAAFGGDKEMVAAVGLLATGVGKKIFGGLFKKKNQTQEDKETNTDSPDDGSPEKRESKNKNYTDNDVIISILNKILNAFENDNERMRRSIRDSEEKKLESDPTPDKIGSPEKVKDKKTDMNKLLMFGAIAGLIGSAFLFKNAIGAMLSPITDMLGITDPTADADKEDYDFDIMDMLGVTSLLGMLGLGGKAAAEAAAKKAAVKAASEKYAAEAAAKAAGGAAAGSAAKAVGGVAAGSAAKAASGAPVKNTVTKLASAVAQRVSEKIGTIAVKSIPILGAAIGAGFGVYELIKGNYVGAAAEVVGGLASVATSLAAGAVGIANDVYHDVYGTYAANDAVNGKLGDGVFKKRMTEIKESVDVALADALTVKAMNAPEFKGAKLDQKTAQDLLQLNKETPLSENDLKIYGGLERITDIANGGKGLSTTKPSSADGAGGAERVPAGGAGSPSAAGAGAGAPSAAGAGAGAGAGAPSAAGAGAGAPSAAGAPTGTGVTKGDMPVGTPTASAPPPPSQTSGSAVTAATMDASEAQNSVTVLPPMISNESNTMKSGNEDASKAQKMTMQVRLNDDVFRKAVESTAAVLKMMKAA
jgi:hypothetical protein